MPSHMGEVKNWPPRWTLKNVLLLDFMNFFFQVWSTNFGILSSPLPRTRRDLTNLKFGPKLEVFFRVKKVDQILVILPLGKICFDHNFAKSMNFWVLFSVLETARGGLGFAAFRGFRSLPCGWRKWKSENFLLLISIVGTTARGFWLILKCAFSRAGTRRPKIAFFFVRFMCSVYIFAYSSRHAKKCAFGRLRSCR